MPYFPKCCSIDACCHQLSLGPRQPNEDATQAKHETRLIVSLTLLVSYPDKLMALRLELFERFSSHLLCVAGNSQRMPQTFGRVFAHCIRVLHRPQEPSRAVFKVFSTFWHIATFLRLAQGPSRLQQCPRRKEPPPRRLTIASASLSRAATPRRSRKVCYAAETLLSSA